MNRPEVCEKLEDRNSQDRFNYVYYQKVYFFITDR